MLTRPVGQLLYFFIPIREISNTDALTGLRNRRYFLDQLSQEYERSARLDQTFAMLSIDLDDFKAINDSYGHNTGDQALISAARAMYPESSRIPMNRKRIRI